MDICLNRGNKRGSVRRVVSVAVACLVSVSVLAACGSSKGSSSGQSSSDAGTVNLTIAGVGEVHEDAALAKQLPAQFKSGIIVATNVPSPPFEALVNGKLQGMDIDISNAIATVLGTQAKIENVNFAGEVPGIQAGKYDMIASGIGDISGRGKILNFTMYDTSPGTVLIIPASNPDHLTSWLDMCGKALAVQTGSHDVALTQGLNKSLCAANGKPAIQLVSLPTIADQIIAVNSGKAAALSETVFEAASLPKGMYQVVMDPQEQKLATALGFGSIRQGVGVSVTQPVLSKLVYQAAVDLSKDGSWKKIISKWGLGPYALDPPLYNQPL
jgi:polar amino acid transport system substrate-binding protein